MALIYIVEDDANIREIEAYALKCGGFDVQQFECARDLYHTLSRRVPDLFLLDLMLPGEDGFQILTRLRSMVQTKFVPIILVTAKTSEIDTVRGLDAGADDYITKPFGIMELLSRVKALLRRTSDAAKDSLLEFGDICMDDERHLVTAGGEVCDLTFKEYELLKLLLKHKGMVMSREVIMERVWGTDFEGESRTLDMHIKTLRQKLKSAGNLICTVRNVGYVADIPENR